VPYFERKPWQETSRTPERGGAETAGETYDFARAARSILHRESARKAEGTGPYRCRAPVAPGGEGRIVLAMAADGDGDALDLAFFSDGLAGPSGTRLPAAAISVEPRSLRVAPGHKETLTITLRVPQDALGGLYHGRISGEGPVPVALEVEFEVKPAG
jgi:hypothetical protein